MILRANRAWLGRPGRMATNVLIDIKDGCVVRLREGVPGVLHEDETILELGDVSLLPGFVDSHVHLGFDASALPQRLMIDDDSPAMTALFERNCADLLRAGVTTARDLGSNASMENCFGAANDSRFRPDLVTAGIPISRKDGHCAFMGGGVVNEDDLGRLIGRNFANGHRFVKVMVSGGFITTGSDPAAVQFSLNEVRAIKRMAHDRGMRVAAHVHGRPAIELAALAAVDTLEHCSFLDSRGQVSFEPRLADLIANSGAYVCLTLNCMTKSYEPEWWDGMCEVAMGLRARGVKIIAGTDAGVAGVTGDRFIAGLDLLREAGFGVDEVLSAATSLSADAIGVGAVTGHIDVGMQADLVAVKGDVFRTAGPFGDIMFVMSQGKIIVRSPGC